MSVSVLFVCMGNICRSPTAHALFREAVTAAGLDDKITTDSAGTPPTTSATRPMRGPPRRRSSEISI